MYEEIPAAQLLLSVIHGIVPDVSGPESLTAEGGAEVAVNNTVQIRRSASKARHQ